MLVLVTLMITMPADMNKYADVHIDFMILCGCGDEIMGCMSRRFKTF